MAAHENCILPYYTYYTSEWADINGLQFCHTNGIVWWYVVLGAANVLGVEASTRS